MALGNQSYANESFMSGGPGGFGGFGGFGGGGLIEGLLFASLLGNRRGGGLFGGNDDGGSADLEASGIAAKVVELQNSTNILAAIESIKDRNTGEFRGIAEGICSLNSAIKDGNYAAAIQAERNTAQLSTQATAFAVAASREADQNTAAILARLNQNEVDNLRDQLNAERRRADAREVEISINNSNSQSQSQVQAQFQAQNDFLVRKFNDFDNQINSTKQGIINLGTMTGSGTQATNATNIR